MMKKNGKCKEYEPENNNLKFEGNYFHGKKMEITKNIILKVVI